MSVLDLLARAPPKKSDKKATSAEARLADALREALREYDAAVNPPVPTVKTGKCGRPATHPSVLQRALVEVEAGASMVEAGRKHGLSAMTLRRWRDRWGGSSPPVSGATTSLPGKRRRTTARRRAG